jgi:class 3 adenylate cyclase/tetratricopeptide (TPR) repeat protein
MKCPQCQHENAGGKFCGECGARLEARCPSCQAVNPPGNKFCGECGASLVAKPGPPPAAPPVQETDPAPPAPPERFASPQAYTPRHLAEKILTSRGAMEGERKQVTVLFTDVSGFTAMSEKLDPEDVHAIMDRAFEIILDTVHRYEGTINQFLGDGVMALFGAPIAHEDHAQQALRAALGVQSGLAPLRDEVRRAHGVEFRVRVGINTGLVVVGAIGKDLRMDYTAVGDTTNLAARILNIAQSGQCALSAHTHRLTEGFFTFDDLGDFTVKGKTEPVRVYAVTSEMRGRTRLEVSKERGLTPLVGRDAEKARLLSAFQRAVEGTGTIVALVGEPGVGKSRLLYEVVHQVERHEGGILELEATCLSHGRSMPYHPVLDLLRRYLDVGDAAPEEQVRRRIGEELERAGLATEEASLLLAYFLGLAVPPEFLVRMQGAQRKEKTHHLLRDLICRASASRPVVIVVENLHWADPSSEEFLALLAEAVPRYRILLVLSTRPGPIAWLPAVAETIALSGLGAGEVQGMILALLSATRVSEDLLKVLLEKSEGNPLYMEEILRQLRETDGIVSDGGEARLRSGDVTVPETIHDLIAARIDRLAEPLKQTLQPASVVGRQFVVPLLTRVADGNGEIVERLGHLQALDFVFLAERQPDLVYSFKHALTQEVVYAGLLERRRRVYHAAVGHGLEQMYAERLGDVVELLAYHFGRSAEAEKAVDYAILAAEKAQRRWANTEALVHFEAALKRLGAMPDTEPNQRRRIDAIVKQAEVKFALGRHAEHVQALEGIKTLVDSVADPPRRAAWYGWAGFLHSLTGARPEVSIAYCRQASEIADAGGFDDLQAFAQCSLAHVYLVAGNLRGVIDAGERALEIFVARGDVWWTCRTLFAMSPAANGLGEWERGLAYGRTILQHGHALNDLRLKVVGWWRTGVTHIYRGDPATGLTCCEEALALSPIAFDANMVKAVRGYGRVKLGDFATGVAELQEAVAWFDQSNLRYTRSLFALWLGEGCLQQGGRDRARSIFEEVLVTSRDLGYRHLEGVAGRLLAEALAPDRAASDPLQAALPILEEIGARNDLAKALVTEARVLGAAGDLAGADERLERAAATFQTLGTLDGPALVETARASLELG